MGRASHRKRGSLAGRPGLSQGDRASHRETGPLTQRPGIWYRGLAFHQEARTQIRVETLPVTDMLDISEPPGWAFHREAWPLTEGLFHICWAFPERLGGFYLCQGPLICFHGNADASNWSTKPEIQIQNMKFHILIIYQNARKLQNIGICDKQIIWRFCCCLSNPFNIGTFLYSLLKIRTCSLVPNTIYNV